MNRRAFIGSLAAVFLIPQSRLSFTSGSFGKLGRWFGNFGSGLAATLHGTEAVVTPAQAPAFARDVIDELHRHPNRILLDGLEMKRWINRQLLLSIESNSKRKGK